MTALVRAELLKLRTLRSTAYAAAAPAPHHARDRPASPWATRGSKGFSTPEQLRETILAIGYSAVFFLAVLGRERGGGRVPPPHDLPALPRQPGPPPGAAGAKLVAYALLGAVVGLVVTAIGAAIGEAVVSSKGYTLDLAGDVAAPVRQHRPGHRAGGHARRHRRPLTRNPTTAMVVIFGVWIAEKIAGGWLGGAGHYLPSR